MSSLDVQYAVACLGSLQAAAGAMALPQLAHTAGIPLSICEDIVGRLKQGGIVAQDNTGQVRLAHSESPVTALEVLEAVWSSLSAPFRMKFGHSRGSMRWTRAWSLAEWPNG